MNNGDHICVVRRQGSNEYSDTSTLGIVMLALQRRSSVVCVGWLASCAREGTEGECI